VSLSCDVVAERGGFRLEARFAGAARVLAVEGPSGAGKTSLLHAIAGLIPVERAVVSVDGRALVDAAGVAPGAHLRRIGYVFQDARLFPHLTVAGNIAFPRRGRPLPAGVQALIDLLDLGPLLGRWPRNLSGGETRRVAVARPPRASTRRRVQGKECSVSLWQPPTLLPRRQRHETYWSCFAHAQGTRTGSSQRRIMIFPGSSSVRLPPVAHSVQPSFKWKMRILRLSGLRTSASARCSRQ
jgi:hypothetical protein